MIVEKQSILILGASGMLGSSLSSFLSARDHVVYAHGQGKESPYHANLTEKHETNALLDSILPSVIIHLVGLTDVDRCEQHPNEAYRINVRTVENVVSWIKARAPQCHLLHVSTDQVYDGTGIHTEQDVTLTNYYAFSKYAAELAAMRVPSTIIRTNFFGRSHCAKRTSLTDWLHQALSQRESIQVFDDVMFSPISMGSLCEIIERILIKKPVGLFNVGTQSGMSKADFAFVFAKVLGLDTASVTRTTTDRVAFLKAYRPKDMRMDYDKIEGLLGITMPFLQDEIKRAAEEYR